MHNTHVYLLKHTHARAHTLVADEKYYVGDRIKKFFFFFYIYSI